MMDDVTLADVFEPDLPQYRWSHLERAEAINQQIRYGIVDDDVKVFSLKIDSDIDILMTIDTTDMYVSDVIWYEFKEGVFEVSDFNIGLKEGEIISLDLIEFLTIEEGDL